MEMKQANIVMLVWAPCGSMSGEAHVWDKEGTDVYRWYRVMLSGKNKRVIIRFIQCLQIRKSKSNGWFQF